MYIIFLLFLDRFKRIEKRKDKNEDFFDEESGDSEDNIMRIKNLKGKATSSKASTSPIFTNEGNTPLKKSSYIQEQK